MLSAFLADVNLDWNVIMRLMEGCAKLNAIPITAAEEREQTIRDLFGSVGENSTEDMALISAMPYFDGSGLHLNKVDF